VEQSEILKLVVARLEQAEISYMLTGSHASSIQGEPRFTHDLDIVIDLAPGETDRLLKLFPEERFYLDAGLLQAAVGRGGMANMIDSASGQKVDWCFLKDQEFDRSRFRRRQRVAYGDVNVSVSAPEDTILMKLRWARQSGGSERQLYDARRVREVQAGRLDLSYIESWLDPLEIRDLWERIQS